MGEACARALKIDTMLGLSEVDGDRGRLLLLSLGGVDGRDG